MFARFFKRKKWGIYDCSELYHLAAISNSVYNPPIHVGSSVTNRYKFYNQSDIPSSPNDVGYRGAFYNKPPEEYMEHLGPAAFVIASRGTDINIMESTFNAFETGLNLIPTQIPAAIQYMNRELSIIENVYSLDEDKKSYWNYKQVYFTGHSLGAIDAACQYATFMLQHLNAENVQCITFENPGSYDIVKNHLITNHKMSEDSAKLFMKKIESEVFNIQADVNIINTCNKQWGYTRRLFVPYQFNHEPLPAIPISPNYINQHYILSYTFQNQHSILQLMDSLAVNRRIEEADKYWPHGFQDSYRYYLNPNSSYDRRDYWNLYFKHIWDRNIKLRESYKNDFDKFREEMLHKNEVLAHVPIKLSVK